MGAKAIQVMLDNGHGITADYKSSPDKRLLEYKWAREMALLIEAELKKHGVQAMRIVPETADISLKERCRRVNEVCKKHGAANCLLISLHTNAAGSDGKWHDATGWSGWVAPNASAASKRMAQLLYGEAARAGLKGNRSVPACKYWVGNFAMVRDTNCPAVLTENLFHDNKGEVDYLLSSEGKAAIAKLHVDAILQYIAEK